MKGLHKTATKISSTPNNLLFIEQYHTVPSEGLVITQSFQESNIPCSLIEAFQETRFFVWLCVLVLWYCCVCVCVCVCGCLFLFCSVLFFASRRLTDYPDRYTQGSKSYRGPYSSRSNFHLSLFKIISLIYPVIVRLLNIGFHY